MEFLPSEGRTLGTCFGLVASQQVECGWLPWWWVIVPLSLTVYGVGDKVLVTASVSPASVLLGLPTLIYFSPETVIVIGCFKDTADLPGLVFYLYVQLHDVDVSQCELFFFVLFWQYSYSSSRCLWSGEETWKSTLVHC